MRCSFGFFGLKVALSGTDLRGPVLNCHMTLSVSPLKWQLEQLCHPSLESRSLVETAAPAGRLKMPRDEKKISAPTATASCGDPGGGSGTFWITLMTLSVVRSTTDTLRETKFVT